MLDNFLQIVEQNGHIPNGGRIYYEQRSQPPMLIPMISQYVNTTGDVDFIRNRIDLIEKEMQFWLQNRTVKVGEYTLARYNVEYDGPRPESYRFVLYIKLIMLFNLNQIYSLSSIGKTLKMQPT